VRRRVSHDVLYPVVERCKCIWIWINDAVRADPSLIPDTHFLDQPAWRGTMLYAVDLNPTHRCWRCVRMSGSQAFVAAAKGDPSRVPRLKLPWRHDAHSIGGIAAALTTGQPHTSRAVSTTKANFAISCSMVSELPSTVDEKPHCGLKQI
jgi:hypothetical protein